MTFIGFKNVKERTKSITFLDKPFKVDFVLVIDRSVNLSAVVLLTDQHQVFDKFTGRAILDDSRIIEVRSKGFPGIYRNSKKICGKFS